MEDVRAAAPSFEIDPLKPTAKLVWPKDLPLISYERSADTTRFLTQASLLTMAASCVWHGGKELVERLAANEAIFDRVTMISITANSYHRLFTHDLSSLDDRSELIQTTYALRDDRPAIAREKLSDPDGDDEKIERQMEGWWKIGNHRDVQMRSVIDYNLWNTAGWKGTFYASYGSQVPPVIGLLFTDRQAAHSIFERWRERFGKVDRKDEIYLSIVRDVSDANPAHYNVLITSSLDPSQVRRPGGAMVLSRFNRMQPDTDTNFRRFLADYERAGVYFLMPAIMEGGEPQLLSGLSILKRNFVVKSARDVGPHDVEHCCLGEKADTHFANTDVEPSIILS